MVLNTYLMPSMRNQLRCYITRPYLKHTELCHPNSITISWKSHFYAQLLEIKFWVLPIYSHHRNVKWNPNKHHLHLHHFWIITDMITAQYSETWHEQVRCGPVWDTTLPLQHTLQTVLFWVDTTYCSRQQLQFQMNMPLKSSRPKELGPGR